MKVEGLGFRQKITPGWFRVYRTTPGQCLLGGRAEVPWRMPLRRALGFHGSEC